MIISIIIFVFSLFILVIIHELGHFLVAKKFGIKVEEFGFGIPPRVFGKKFGETLYSLNALPLGGFVRLQGEDEGGKIKDKRDFRAKPVLQRILVVIAGVVMNLVLAWVIFYVSIFNQNFKIIFPTLDQSVYIGFLEKGYPAEKSGINLGDKIVKVNGTEIKDGSVETKIEKTRNLIKQSKENQVLLTVSDLGGHLKDVYVTPKKIDDDYKIGVVFSPVAIKEYKTNQEKILSGVTYSFDLTKLTFLGLGKTVSDVFGGNIKAASQSVAGPVGMAKASNDILSSGPGAVSFYLWFVGVISLTLAIFNTLPIPALDGGRLLFLVIEAITRKKVKEETERMVHQIGFMVLLGLALLVTFSDISKLLR